MFVIIECNIHYMNEEGTIYESNRSHHINTHIGSIKLNRNRIKWFKFD